MICQINNESSPVFYYKYTYGYIAELNEVSEACCHGPCGATVLITQQIKIQLYV